MLGFVNGSGCPPCGPSPGSKRPVQRMAGRRVGIEPPGLTVEDIPTLVAFLEQI